MPESTRYLTEGVAKALAREIEEAGGAEIFAVLTRDDPKARFDTVQVACRGLDTEVPALVSRTKPGDMTVHNHPSGSLKPSAADLNVATMFGEEGVGSMIVDNRVGKCYIVVEPYAPPPKQDIGPEEVAAIFEPGGALSQKLSRYETRESQVEMAARVTHTLNEGKILAVEAGTGTGKSLAYLIPALLWTKRNQGRVAIATKTIALQEQLVYKDIPIARQAVPDAPKASLVKGRNNYVCLRKLNDLKSNQLDLFAPEESSVKKEIEDLAEWVAESGSGDMADLPFTPSRDAWDMVRSDADMCLGAKCPFFQKAPFYESRRRAAQSKILIVNQALLFSDLAVRQASGNYKASAVIPPYEHIILDEAHSVEDIATDHFGEKLSSFGLRLTLGKFLGKTKNQRGLLHRLFQATLDHGAFDFRKALDDALMPDFRFMQEQTVDQLYAMSNALFNALNPERRGQAVFWLKDSLLETGKLDEAKEEAKKLLGLAHELMLILKKIREMAYEQSEAFLERMEGLLIELDARMGRLNESVSALRNFAIQAKENQIPWLELRPRRQYDEFEYRVSPLDVSPVLRESLFKPFKSIVMTSATLDLKDGFEFLSSRNGLLGWEERDWSFAAYPSPFDYRRQTRLFVAQMDPAPNQHGFVDCLFELILGAACSPYQGGTLVLFTSYQMLNAAARRLEGPLAAAGVNLLVQGRAARSFLVDQLKKTRGVLLGTDSFWEGIDLPGDALSKLIIAKLPFRQVGDPIFEARCAALEADGKSSFKEYSLPLALLKFKQGAGRLIRHKDDSGVLIVADNRIRSKYYGRKFLGLVDGYPLTHAPADELFRLLEQQGQTA